MPFYRRVSQLRQASKPQASVGAVSLESPDELRQFLSKEGVSADGVYKIPFASGLRGTPTVLIVDEKGTIRRVFEGKLDSSREQAILDIIATGKIS